MKFEKEAFEVPKFKPHTGTGKRVRVSSTGKILRKHAGIRHRLISKSSHSTRRTGTESVSEADTKRVKKLLGR
jgi:large subunit ribosomal protein L35